MTDNYSFLASVPAVESVSIESLNSQRIKNVIYSADYFQKAIMLVNFVSRKILISNANPELNSIFDSLPQKQEIDEDVFVDLIPPENRQLFFDSISIANQYMFKNCRSENNVFYFTLHVPLMTGNRMGNMVSVKLFPNHYNGYDPDRMPLVAYYQFDIDQEAFPGGFSIHYPIESVTEKFYIQRTINNEVLFHTFNDAELSVFDLARKGFSENEIASHLNLSLGALKHMKSTIMLKLNSYSTAQTISKLTRQGVI